MQRALLSANQDTHPWLKEKAIYKVQLQIFTLPETLQQLVHLYFVPQQVQQLSPGCYFLQICGA